MIQTLLTLTKLGSNLMIDAWSMEMTECLLTFSNVHEAMDYANSRGLSTTREDGNGHDVTLPLTQSGEHVFTVIDGYFIPNNFIE